MIKFTPQRITYNEIREIVEEFRAQTPRAQKIPIDVEEIIEFDLGLNIIPVPELKMRTDVEAFLSHSLSDIWVDYGEYNTKFSRNRLQFTLAEEIGHLDRETGQGIRWKIVGAQNRIREIFKQTTEKNQSIL
ncbi:hypothetical protein L0P88_08225 [Muricauda sp. SCSIO 64092]|uniref:hypothetical protein n=1 Tax=Allomuricauda sp. SCSIO 64092 TaxID=2908842 RepID=UPI001FF4C18F|nr:hypothetical protein [Muricauda sp. SCSIO 64092]UOY08528.1 hypothetical protein L0P88_08225 [Muricauda sp. SCSIO 64092]